MRVYMDAPPTCHVFPVYMGAVRIRHRTSTIRQTQCANERERQYLLPSTWSVFSKKFAEKKTFLQRWVNYYPSHCQRQVINRKQLFSLFNIHSIERQFCLHLLLLHCLNYISQYICFMYKNTITHNHNFSYALRK